MPGLALDIGGANLKVADGRSFALSRPFQLWRNRDGLANAVARILHQSPPADSLSVTMTGELADCYTTKSEGVEAILEAVERAADRRAVHVYMVDGRLVDVATARRSPLLVAAANWHALAVFCCRYVHGEAGLLIDIGSTTSDIIALSPAGPVAVGRSDPERLLAGELVYSGIERSPLCAVTSSLPWRSRG